MTPINVLMCPSDPGPTFSPVPARRRRRGPQRQQRAEAQLRRELRRQPQRRQHLLAVPQPALSRENGFGENKTQTGIMCRSGGTVAIRDVTDGLSNTFAVGESLFETNDWWTWANPNGSTCGTSCPICYNGSPSTTATPTRR